jgi:cytochrome c peroxidase
MRRTPRSPCQSATAARLAFSACLALPCAGCAVEPTDDPQPTSSGRAQTTTATRDYAREKLSDAGTYRVSIRPRRQPIPLREFHQWIVHVESPDGVPSMLRSIGVSGGMPEHGHGFPSLPLATESLGGGDYLIEGVEFNMEGLWQIVFRLDGLDTDRVRFDLDIRDEPGDATAARARLLASLALAALPPLPIDPSNRVGDDARAAEFGRELFFDKSLSANGQVACATCHVQELLFADGKRFSEGLGQTVRNAPSLLGTGYSRWFFWDGRRDSLWAQALVPLESPREMGSTRVEVVRHVVEQPRYRSGYESLFGPVPDVAHLPLRASPLGDDAAQAAWAAMDEPSRAAVDRAFANVGKLVAAFERRLVPSPSKFDRYVAVLLDEGEAAARRVLTADELAGLRLFVDSDRTQCLRCHNGPLLTNGGFHAIGTGELPDRRVEAGRYAGIREVLRDPFRCGGPHSDCASSECRHLRFMSLDAHALRDLQGAFKVPSLRNVAKTAPYMHDGRYATLEAVIDHYRTPPPGRHELAPTSLSPTEVRQLVAFLGTLTGQ